MVNEIRQHLKKDLVPFWTNLRDSEYGGYYGYMDNNGIVNKKSDKGAILHHRILWFFSNAYIKLGDSKILEEAKHAYEFVTSYCLDQEHGGSIWSITFDGKIKDSTKHTYCQAFMIYALASYYNASKDEEALKIALSIFELIEDKCKDTYGYLEAFNKKFEPIENDKLSENGIIAEKTMNTLLHVFEAYTELYYVSRDQRVKDQLKWILDLFVDKVYNKKLKRQEVFFDKKMNTLIDLHSYGHDIETAWLLDRGCAVLGDKAYSMKVGAVTKALTEEIYDRAYSDYYLMNEKENGIDDKTRIWWVQGEAIVGFINGYQVTSDEKYLEAAKSIWSYVKNYFITKTEPCEWYSELTEEDQPNFEKPLVEPWKCPYHNGRMCMEVMSRMN